MSRDPSQDKNTTTPSNILDSLINLFKSNTEEPASTTRDASPEDVEVLLAPPAPPPSPNPEIETDHTATVNPPPLVAGQEDTEAPPPPPLQPMASLPPHPSCYFFLPTTT